jgi:hypothetical protein
MNGQQNSQLHPTFQHIVNAAMQSPEALAQIERNLYAQKLRQHDWHYEYSDDGHTYRKGRQEREELRRLQQRLDRDFSIWNEHCAPGFQTVCAG